MIRKTALLVTGTVAGVVGVVSYNPPQLDAAISPAKTTPPTSNASASSVKAQNSQQVQNQQTSQSTNSTKTSPQSSKKATPTPTPSDTAKKSSGTSGTFVGDTSQTRWGPVQVQVTVTDGKITDVKTLQYPNGDRRSQGISSQVIPWLQDETLQVQSANIQGISGATYTSMGFRTSLASALQKAGI